MRNRDREVVVTGTGLCCHMGDDWTSIETALRTGQSTPFSRWAPAVEHGTQCQVVGIYPNDLPLELLEIEKQQARFMGRAALLALRATRLALEQAQIPTRDVAVVVGSGTGDVDTHRDMAARLTRERGARRVSPTVIPRLMASTVSANLATVLGATGPSFTVTAACAGGAYNVLLAAQLIEFGHVDAAIAGGVEVADIHFHVGFDAMRAYTAKGQRSTRPGLTALRSRSRGLCFLRGCGHPRPGDPGRSRGPRGDDPRSSPWLRDVFGRLRQHGGAGGGRRGTGDASGTGPRGGGGRRDRLCEHPRHFDARGRRPLRCRPSDACSTAARSHTPPPRATQAIRFRRPAPSRRSSPWPCSEGAGSPPASTWRRWIRTSPTIPPVLEPESRDLSLAVSNSFGFGGTNVTLVLGKG